MSKVMIIGAGPSALFAAKVILENSHTISVDILEQGKAQSERRCPADYAKCMNCSSCATLEGVGGAGLFSDGKLVLDLTSGGRADGISQLPLSERNSLEEYIKDTFISFDGVSEFKDKPSTKTQDDLRELFQKKNLDFKFYDVLHMGTKNLQNITSNFVNYLEMHFKNRFKIEVDKRVYSIERNNAGYDLLTSNGAIYADAVIAAVGKSGAKWLNKTLQPLGCKFISHDFFFGFRMETLTENIKDLVEYSFDPKIYRTEAGRKVKIHCVCRNGQTRFYRHGGALVVGGHSPYTLNNNYETNLKYANFNILVSFDKKQFSVEDLLNDFRAVSDDVIVVQKLVDFVNGQSSLGFGKVVPSNLSLIQLGNIRSIMDWFDLNFSGIIIRFLRSLAELYPKVVDDDNILYAPAIEWDMDTVTVNQYMETECQNLFAIGDGAGLSQGIVYSAATGIIAAKEIAERFEEKNI